MTHWLVQRIVDQRISKVINGLQIYRLIQQIRGTHEVKVCTADSPGVRLDQEGHRSRALWDLHRAPRSTAAYWGRGTLICRQVPQGRIASLAKSFPAKPGGKTKGTVEVQWVPIVIPIASKHIQWHCIVGSWKWAGDFKTNPVSGERTWEVKAKFLQP